MSHILLDEYHNHMNVMDAMGSTILYFKLMHGFTTVYFLNGWVLECPSTVLVAEGGITPN